MIQIGSIHSGYINAEEWTTFFARNASNQYEAGRVEDESVTVSRRNNWGDWFDGAVNDLRDNPVDLFRPDVLPDWRGNTSHEQHKDGWLDAQYRDMMIFDRVLTNDELIQWRTNVPQYTLGNYNGPPGPFHHFLKDPNNPLTDWGRANLSSQQLSITEVNWTAEMYTS